MYHAGQNISGDVVPLRDPSRRCDPSGLPHMPNLAGVGPVSVHAISERSHAPVLPFSAALRIHRIAICLLRLTPRPRAWQVLLGSSLDAV